MTTIYQNARSEEEVREEIKAMQKASKKITKDSKTAFNFLVDNGFITPDGKLTKQYGGK